MKKQKCGQLLIVAVLLLVVVGFITYRAMLTTPSQEMTPESQVAAILEDGGCISCHSANPELPFYANIPVAGDMVKADAKEGYRAFDIEGVMTKLKDGGALNPVDVAKIEKVALDKRMPMAKYYLVHWGSQMTDEKAAVIGAWARDYRTAYYNDGLTGERAGEPVRPIMALADVVLADECLILLVAYVVYEARYLHILCLHLLHHARLLLHDSELNSVIDVCYAGIELRYACITLCQHALQLKILSRSYTCHLLTQRCYLRLALTNLGTLFRHATLHLDIALRLEHCLHLGLTALQFSLELDTTHLAEDCGIVSLIDSNCSTTLWTFQLFHSYSD